MRHSRIRIQALVPALVLAALVGPVLGAPPAWETRAWNDAPVRIALPDRAAVDRLLADVPLGDFHRESLRPTGEGWELRLRVTPSEAAALAARGYTAVPVPDDDRSGRMAAEAAWATRAAAGVRLRADPVAKSDAPAITDYPTHAELGALLADLVAAYPALCDTFTWGRSVQGRELWGLKISADVATTAPEPEVRLSSAIHGNETVGLVLLVNLAHHLLANYGQVGYEDVTALVDGTEIHLLPLHNPDGYAVGTRGNANGDDLNRNFLLPAGTDPVVEPENLAFMAHAGAHHFVLSANGHGGALVVNYPWDYTATLAPNTPAIVQLSLAYSTTNPAIYNGPFPQGITNGYDWYVAYGTLQDWSYDQTGCIDLTLEQSYIKWPHFSTLTGFWDDNRQSLLNLVAAARWGINGAVTDSVSGEPLDALVAVAGDIRPVRTDPAHGDYWLVLDDGTYDLTISADGYHTRTLTGVTAAWGTSTVRDVVLAPTAADTVPDRLPTRVAVRAWPNPFNPGTRLEIAVPRAGRVTVDVYDVRGRHIDRLASADAAAGLLPVAWDGRDGSGRTVPAGVYFARAVTAAGTAVTKLALVR